LFSLEIACVLQFSFVRSALRHGLAAALVACATLPTVLAAETPKAQKTLTIPELFATSEPANGLTSTPPKGIVWSPDGTRLTYLADSGDLIQVEGASGVQSVLISKAKLSALLAKPGNEVDRDHRARYGQSNYIWVPDSKHLLFDADGELWYYTIANGTAVEIAQTGAGSGDDPKFSPDGKLLTYLHDRNLYLRHLEEPQAQAFALTSSKEESVLNGQVDWVYEEELDVRSNYYWSPDSKNIAYLQMYEAAVPKYPLTDWIPIHATVTDQRYPQPGDPNPVVRVGIVGARNGRTTWLKVPLDVGNDYIPRFGWINSKVVWVETLTRDHKHRNLYFADIATGEVKQVLTEADEKFLDETYDLTFNKNTFLWMSWRDGHTHVYKYSFDENAPLASEAKLEVQLTSGDFEVESVKGIDVPKDTVYYLSNEGDPREQQLWAVKLDGTNRRRVSTQPGVHSVVFSPNAKFFSDETSSSMTPPTVNTCREETDCRIFWTTPRVAAYNLVPPEQWELKAADEKTTLYATLLMPSGKAKKDSIPLIVNPYGGPGVQTVRNGWSGARGLLFDEVLAQHGYAVLHVDNRGMGGRGREFAQAAYHNFGPVQLQDQLAAIDQVLASHKDLDPKQLGWWGWSWGGTFTLYALSHSDRFRAGVAVAPVTDWRNYDSIYTERYMSMPVENQDGYRDDSVVNSAKDLKGRLLLVQGTGDDNVHMANSIQYIQKLIDANVPYDLQLYPRKTHSIAGQEARTHLFDRILAQFQMYLGKDAPGQKFLMEDGAGK
jgi:dipeptidyl-peptidase-4